MARIARIKLNDASNGDGICVSLWVQGCPHRCKGCHNPETWDFNSGKEIPVDIKGQIVKGLCANGVQRNFAVLGGEPLCKENLEFVENVISAVRAAYPHIKIYVWTGYTYSELFSSTNSLIQSILEKIDYLIDGPFIEEEKDLTLKWRGSSNQEIIELNHLES